MRVESASTIPSLQIYKQQSTMRHPPIPQIKQKDTCITQQTWVSQQLSNRHHLQQPSTQQLIYNNYLSLYLSQFGRPYLDLDPPPPRPRNTAKPLQILTIREIKKQTPSVPHSSCPRKKKRGLSVSRKVGGEYFGRMQWAEQQGVLC